MRTCHRARFLYANKLCFSNLSHTTWLSRSHRELILADLLVCLTPHDPSQKRRQVGFPPTLQSDPSKTGLRRYRRLPWRARRARARQGAISRCARTHSTGSIRGRRPRRSSKLASSYIIRTSKCNSTKWPKLPATTHPSRRKASCV